MDLEQRVQHDYFYTMMCFFRSRRKLPPKYNFLPVKESSARQLCGKVSAVLGKESKEGHAV